MLLLHINTLVIAVCLLVTVASSVNVAGTGGPPYNNKFGIGAYSDYVGPAYPPVYLSPSPLLPSLPILFSLFFLSFLSFTHPNYDVQIPWAHNLTDDYGYVLLLVRDITAASANQTMWQDYLKLAYPFNLKMRGEFSFLLLVPRTPSICMWYYVLIQIISLIMKQYRQSISPLFHNFLHLPHHLLHCTLS